MYEKILNTFVGVGGSIATYAFGGWSAALSLLALLAVADFVTGIAASTVEGVQNPDDKTKGLSSKKGFVGIAKKAAMFMIIAIMYRIDVVLGLSGTLSLSAGAIYFYLANEGISLAENLGRIGVPLPEGFKKAITMLKDKGENKES